jgi:TRAP-type C4-dicarboxylate transport system permease large subunit
VFLANRELGCLTPPTGQNLFLSSLRFNQPVAKVFRTVLPMVAVLIVGVLPIAYVPMMTTAFSRWLGEGGPLKQY